MDLIVETTRLYCRRFTMNDTGFILKLLNSPGWLAFIGDRNVRTEVQAKDYLLNVLIKSYNDNGFGLGMVVLKDSKEAIGMCGLIKRAALNGVDIGFAFLPEHTGKGYAFEMAAATILYARQMLQLPAVLAIVIPANVKSIKLLETIGMQFQKEVTLPADAVPVMLYSTDVKPA